MVLVRFQEHHEIRYQSLLPKICIQRLNNILCHNSFIMDSRKIYPQPAIVLKTDESNWTINCDSLVEFLRQSTSIKMAPQLHIGIALKEGIVIHYTKQKGVTLDEYWPVCHPIPGSSLGGLQSEPAKSALLYHCLEFSSGEEPETVSCHQDLWSKELYDEDTHNCLDFVVDCLKKSRIVHDRLTKEQFIKDFISGEIVLR